MYDEYCEKKVKERVTEYLIDSHMPDCRDARILDLTGECPIDLPMMYAKGRISSGTAIDCVNRIMSCEGSLGKTSAKEKYFSHMLRRNLRNAIGSDDLSGDNLKVHFTDVFDFVPANSYRFAYVDTCSQYSEKAGEWLKMFSGHVDDGGVVALNFTTKRYSVDTSMPVPKCRFLSFNLSGIDMEQHERRFIGGLANSIIDVLGKRNPLKLEALVSYRNEKKEESIGKRGSTQSMGILIFRKRIQCQL